MFEQPYVFHPSKYSPALGYSQLDIYLSKDPTKRFFDTKQARFLLNRSGNVGPVIIDHPWEEWMGGSDQQVCAGRVVMTDHKDNTHYAFSMGGKLSIENEEGYTVCKLVSTAPIFNLQDHLATDLETSTQLLIDEFEDLFAIRQAHWLSEETEYNTRLATAEPLILFAASLTALELRYQAFPIPSRSRRIRNAIQTVQRAIQLLRENGDWPEEVPDLDEIL